MAKNENEENKDASKRYIEASKAYQQAIDKYTGRAGQNLINQMAGEGARKIGQGMQGQASAAARNAGLTAAQAADLGGAAATKGYYDAYADQQKTAAGQLAAKLGAEATKFGTEAQQADLEKQREFQRKALPWQITGQSLMGLGSMVPGIITAAAGAPCDERLKDYKTMSEYVEEESKKPRCKEDLIWTKKN